MLANAKIKPKNYSEGSFCSESNMNHSKKVIHDVKTGRANSVSFTDEAFDKIINEEVDFDAIYRRTQYLFSKGIKKVEFDVEELEKWGKKSAFGKLSKYANPALIPLEEGAWERAVAEKYGKSAD